MPQSARPHSLKPWNGPGPPPTKRSRAKPEVDRKCSTACGACQKRKTKCSGEPAPCQMCCTLGTRCVIDPSLDLRRKVAFQQMSDVSKAYQATLSALFEVLRNGQAPQIEAVISQIRSAKPLRLIATAIQEEALKIRNARLEDKSPEFKIEDPLELPLQDEEEDDAQIPISPIDIPADQFQDY